MRCLALTYQRNVHGRVVPGQTDVRLDVRSAGDVVGDRLDHLRPREEDAREDKVEQAPLAPPAVTCATHLSKSIGVCSVDANCLGWTHIANRCLEVDKGRLANGVLLVGGGVRWGQELRDEKWLQRQLSRRDLKNRETIKLRLANSRWRK